MEIINVKEMTKQEVIANFAKHEGDTGSPEVQIALLTQRILQLNDHFAEHKKRLPFQKRFVADGR